MPHKTSQNLQWSRYIINMAINLWYTWRKIKKINYQNRIFVPVSPIYYVYHFNLSKNPHWMAQRKHAKAAQTGGLCAWKQCRRYSEKRPRPHGNRLDGQFPQRQASVGSDEKRVRRPSEKQKTRLPIFRRPSTPTAWSRRSKAACWTCLLSKSARVFS